MTKFASRWIVGAGVPLLLLLVGCVMPTQMSQMEQDVADVKQQQGALRREQDEAMRAIAEMERAPASPAVQRDAAITREEYAELRLELDRLMRQTQMTDERLRDVNSRLDTHSQELERTRSMLRAGAVVPLYGPQVPEEGLPGDAGNVEIPDEGDAVVVATPPDHALPDPEALYNTAYTDFSKGNYALAIAGFQEYQSLFPQSALADNALYWIGECYYSQAEYSLAVSAFDDLLERYPKSDKAAASNLKKALAFLEQNQVGTGIVQLRHVIENFPGTDEARIAEDRLAGLGSSST